MNNELTELDENTKSHLISLINQSDIRQLRSLPLHTYNLDFLIEDKEIQFDKKITPLLAACYIGKYETITLLLSNEKIDVNLASYSRGRYFFYQGYTPLMVASFKGYYEIVRILLERKADVNKMNTQGQTPILFCFSRLEEQRYKYENKKICMMMIELLLSNGANINVRIDVTLGYTVLMKLASSDIFDKEKLSNTIEIIQFLIERGADKNIRGYDGKTVFDVVRHAKFKEEILKVLNYTKQIYFYTLNKKENQSPESNKKNNENNDFYDANITKTNCCNICNIL